MARTAADTERLEKLNDLYSPSAPIDSQELFYGRGEQLNKVHDAVTERGLHIVLYGERGVGKTSLANIVEQRYKAAITAKVTCNSLSTLDGVWRSAFRKIPIRLDSKRLIGFDLSTDAQTYVAGIEMLSDRLRNTDPLNVDLVTSYLELLRDLHVKFLLIFDEFDQITDRPTVQGFADIIKYLSDNIPNFTVMIVGIGRSISDLIGEHESIERCVRQISLERMSDSELKEIVASATSALRMSIAPAVVSKIVAYSSGFPHYTHLLAKYTTRSAILSGSKRITSNHFELGMKGALDNVDESIRKTYETAVLSPREDTLFHQVLFACAMVETDEHGTFRSTDLGRQLEHMYNQPRKLQAFQYHLGKLCSDERGRVLERIRVAKSRGRYRIRNPLFKAYLRLKYHQEQHFQSENQKT